MKEISFEFETKQETEEHGTVTIHAEGKAWSTPSSMYAKNGDPGSPSEGGITYTKIEAWDWDDKPIPGFKPDMDALAEKVWESI